jgi:hypothetical protein
MNPSVQGNSHKHGIQEGSGMIGDEDNRTARRDLRLTRKYDVPEIDMQGRPHNEPGEAVQHEMKITHPFGISINTPLHIPDDGTVKEIIGRLLGVTRYHPRPFIYPCFLYRKIIA